MPDLRRVHRFRDHPIAGVNWRPIRFVDEVSTSRVCGLCGMIPKKTVILPCEHVLCQSCHAGNTQGSGGRCPFDQEPFEEAECVSYDLPTRRANALKVHCWNEGHGCRFEGAVELMLRHYENECTFHTVECLRCGEKVQHRALSTHYAAGCRGAVSSPRSENASSDSQALTLQDVTAALEELKTLLRDANHEQLLLAIQTQMNELIEQNRNQECRSAVITHNVAAPATSETAQVAAPSTSTSLQGRTSRQNPTEEVNTPSKSRSCSEETLMHRQLEPLVDLPKSVLQRMRKTSSQEYPQHVITGTVQGVELYIRSTTLLSTTVTWRELLGSVRYVVTFDIPLCLGCFEGKVADITVLHTRDAYFMVQIMEFKRQLYTRIKFHGVRGDSVCPLPAFVVKGCNLSSGYIYQMSSLEEPCNCKHERGSWIHCHRTYSMRLNSLESTGFEQHITEVEIELCRQ